MSSIDYIEATCDVCSDEITNENQDVEFAILRNGTLLCKTCGDQRSDQVFKWFTVIHIPEDDPTTEEIFEDIDALEIDESQKDLLKRQHLENTAKDEPEE